MDLNTLRPVERTVDVLHPVTGEPTGLQLLVAHDTDPRVVQRQRAIFDAERDGKSPADERGRKLAMAQVVGWKWTGEANFEGKKPEFSDEAFAKVCEVPPVAGAVYKAVMNESGFYKG